MTSNNVPNPSRGPLGLPPRQLRADCEACSIRITVERVTHDSARAHAWFVSAARPVQCPACSAPLKAVVAVLLALVLLAACGDDSRRSAAAIADAGEGNGHVGLVDTTRDAGDVDASEPGDVDAGELQPDAGDVDAGELQPDAGDVDDAGELQPDAGDVDDAGELQPDAGDVDPLCTGDGVQLSVCESADCERVCFWTDHEDLSGTVCCEDPRYPGGTEPCTCPVSP